MAKQILLVVDGNWVLHRAAHTLHTHRSELGKALARHFVSIICKDAMAVRATHLLVAFDGDKIFRHKIYPNYKVGRGAGPSVSTIENADVTKKVDSVVEGEEREEPKELYSYLPDVFEYLEKLSIAYYQPMKHEADDVLCSMAHWCMKMGIRFVGGTQDKDGYQYLLTKDVVLYDSSFKNPKTKETEPRIIDRKYAERVKGVKVEQMIDYQTLLGDKLDNILGLPGFGPKTVQKILDEFGSIENWKKKGSKAHKQLIAENQARLVLNAKLVTLSKKAAPSLGLEEMKVGKISEKRKEKMRTPKAYNNYVAWLYPKSKGLFSSLGK